MALRFSRATALRLPRATALRLPRATALRILRPARAIPALSAADLTSRLLRMAPATESGDGDTGATGKPSDWSNEPIARGQAARLEGAALLDAAQAAEAVVIVVAPGRWQRPGARQRHPIDAAVQPDGRAAAHDLGGQADHARHGWRLRDGQRHVLEEAGAHDRVGLGQRLEHGRRAVRGVILAGQEDGLDAEPLAGLDAPDDLDELVAAGVPGDDCALRPELLSDLGRLVGHELLLGLRRPLRAQRDDP